MVPGRRLRPVDRLVHVLGQLHVLEGRVAGERHLKAVRQIEGGPRFPDADLQHTPASRPILADEVRMPAWRVEPAHVIRAVQADDRIANVLIVELCLVLGQRHVQRDHFAVDAFKRVDACIAVPLQFAHGDDAVIVALHQGLQQRHLIQRIPVCPDTSASCSARAQKPSAITHTIANIFTQRFMFIPPFRSAPRIVHSLLPALHLCRMA